MKATSFGFSVKLLFCVFLFSASSGVSTPRATRPSKLLLKTSGLKPQLTLTLLMKAKNQTKSFSSKVCILSIHVMSPFSFSTDPLQSLLLLSQQVVRFGPSVAMTLCVAIPNQFPVLVYPKLWRRWMQHSMTQERARRSSLLAVITTGVLKWDMKGIQVTDRCLTLTYSLMWYLL